MTTDYLTYKIITLRSRFHHNIFDSDLTLRLICIWGHSWCDLFCFNFSFYFTNWIGRRRFIRRLKITRQFGSGIHGPIIVLESLVGQINLPVEHVALVLILGMLELLMLQCLMLLETFQNSKQLDLTGLSVGNLSKNKIQRENTLERVPSVYTPVEKFYIHLELFRV